MRKSVKRFSALLLALVMITAFFTGCESKGSANTTDATVSTEAATTAPAATEATAAPAAEVDLNAPDIAVYAWMPLSWGRATIWAWKDGGPNAFEEWPGKNMKLNEATMTFEVAVPGWVDRVIIIGEEGAGGVEGQPQTAEVAIEPGQDVLIYAEDLTAPTALYNLEELELTGEVVDDPFWEAAMAEDYETMKELLPTIEDRSILMSWDYNDFNRQYAIEAIRNGDYETAIEFFGYCMSESDQQHANIFRLLVDGNTEEAIDAMIELGFSRVESELDMTWAEIICMVTGIDLDSPGLDSLFTKEYLTRRMWNNQPYFTENSLVFGEHSTWTSEGYIGEITGNDFLIPVEDIDELYSQCGSEPNGKILILRTQQSFPKDTTHYAVDLSVMNYLSYDLYPASLSEVEYIIEVNYDYTNEAEYKQTFTMGDNDQISYFYFLRMEGLVKLIDAKTGETIKKYPLVKGIGEAQAHFSELNYQCSDMPETGVHIIEAVEMIRAKNASEN